MPWGLQKVEAPRVSTQLAHEGGKAVSPVHQLPFPLKASSVLRFTSIRYHHTKFGCPGFENPSYHRPLRWCVVPDGWTNTNLLLYGRWLRDLIMKVFSACTAVTILYEWMSTIEIHGVQPSFKTHEQQHLIWCPGTWQKGQRRWNKYEEIQAMTALKGGGNPLSKYCF